MVKIIIVVVVVKMSNENINDNFSSINIEVIETVFFDERYFKYLKHKKSIQVTFNQIFL